MSKETSGSASLFANPSNSVGDGTAGSGALVGDPHNGFGDGTCANRESAAVDAQFGAATTWDFDKSTVGRNGIRNDGVGARSRVRY
ncbi:hypothetical protein VM98_34540, partial [Streptomyces rubellomurinus subsp. indigoferus]